MQSNQKVDKSEPMDCSETELQRDGSSKVLESNVTIRDTVQSLVSVPHGSENLATDEQRRRQDADLVLKYGLSHFGLLYFTLVADGAIPPGYLADFFRLEIPAQRAAARRLNHSASVTDADAATGHL